MMRNGDNGRSDVNEMHEVLRSEYYVERVTMENSYMTSSSTGGESRRFKSTLPSGSSSESCE